jgi:hypothetical protein
VGGRRWSAARDKAIGQDNGDRRAVESIREKKSPFKQRRDDRNVRIFSFFQDFFSHFYSHISRTKNRYFDVIRWI